MRHRFLNRPKKRRNTPEYDFHCSVADKLNEVLDQSQTCWSSIENSNHTGGVSGLIKQGKDKRKGVKAGVPDLFILYNGTSLWLELKAKKGKTSSWQDLFHIQIRLSKNNIEIIRTIDELMAVLLLYKVPTLVNALI